MILMVPRVTFAPDFINCSSKTQLEDERLNLQTSIGGNVLNEIIPVYKINLFIIYRLTILYLKGMECISDVQEQYLIKVVLILVSGLKFWPDLLRQKAG